MRHAYSPARTSNVAPLIASSPKRLSRDAYRPGRRVVREGVAGLMAKQMRVGSVLSSDEWVAVTRLLTRLLQLPAEAFPSTSGARDVAEPLISTWVRAFPEHDNWLVHFLGAIPLLSSRVDYESRKVVGPLGPSPNAFGLLCALRRAGAPYRLTPTELYDVVVLSPAGVAGLLEGLERHGLIARSIDPRDKRLNRAELTSKGQKLVRSTIGEFVMRHDWLLRPLSDGEREQLATLLRQLLWSAESRRSDIVAP